MRKLLRSVPVAMLGPLLAVFDEEVRVRLAFELFLPPDPAALALAEGNCDGAKTMAGAQATEW